MSIQTNFPNLKPTLLLDFANTKALDPRITFTRASTATYYDGKTVAKAEENLLTYSQSLDTAAGWTSSGATVSANTTTAPDGTSTAESVAETATTVLHWIFTADGVFTASAAVYTFSVFLKKGVGATAPDIVQLTFRSAGAGAAQYANFNLSTGAVTASADLTSSSITAVGNGWYRCSITRTLTAAANTGGAIAFCNNNPTATRAQNYAGATTSDVYVWGAQLEQRSAVSSYTPTTTQTITNYIPVLLTAASGAARFDSNPTTGESLGLLIEEQRTNLLTYSAQFDNAAWSKPNSDTITANTVVAPDGILSGDAFVETTATGTHTLFQNATLVGGTIYTLSVYLKASGRSLVRLKLIDDSDGNGVFADFNIVSGSVVFGPSAVGTGGNAAASVVAVGNGWFRCVVTGSLGASITAGRIRIRTIATAGGLESITGIGATAYYIWGAQLEAGTFPTSYIPTAASQVTRSADAASMTGTNFSSWYNQAEGSFYSEFIPSVTSSPSLRSIIYVDNTIPLYVLQNSTTLKTFDGTTVVATSNGIASGVAQKGAVCYGSSTVSLVLNSGTVVTGSFDGIYGSLAAYFGASNAAANFLNGTIRKIAYYPARVTNTQLQGLTS